ncbi:MAG TPA: hypothetical protein PKD09_02675 [Aggregatilinea sp.]|jgi:hypothetical protein|uniref:DUF7916 family protein n=1 Tax=Aggregatilinea sp. TaxID=2806333 RepID=UPI002C7866CA|nr:hypothetical protein [Aggregatilinea sp.]HML20523.1 hypothetical protein [Aggregatilinea sp.]
MAVRLLDAFASDFARMSGADLAASIRQAEGRTLAAEVILSSEPPVEGVSHGEIAAAMGADLIALDAYDPFAPAIPGAPASVLDDPTPLEAYSRLLGRPVGINLIVADADLGSGLGGRRVSEASVEAVAAQGADFVFLYVRPKMGGTPEMMQAAARLIADRAPDVMLIGVPSFSLPAPRDAQGVAGYLQQASALLDAGCAGIGLPAPGSKQGWLFEPTAQIIDAIHAREALAWLFVTGSIEGASTDAMVQIALAAKQLGADAVRLDEAGLSGMPVPENILVFSIALRGKRHTYRRMAASILR